MAFTEENVKKRFNFSQGKCECCERELVWKQRDRGIEGSWHAHHVVPKSTIDDDTLSNMAILCTDEPINCHINQGHGETIRKLKEKNKERELNF